MKQALWLGFSLLLFIPSVNAQRWLGFTDSTSVPLNATEEFVVGRHTLYKKHISTGNLQVIENFYAYVQADTVFTGYEDHFILDFAFTSPSHLWVVYGNYLRPGALFESTDAGQTWTERSDLYTYPAFPLLKEAVAIKNYNNRLYFFQDYYSSGITYSDNQGADWDTLVYGSACHYVDLGFCQNGDVYAYSSAVDGRGVHVVRVNGVPNPYSYNIGFQADPVGMLYYGNPRIDSIRYVCQRLVNDSICPLLPLYVPETVAGESVSIFPNPAGDVVYFSNLPPSHTYTANIYDATGKRLTSTNLLTGGGLDVSALDSGVYFVQIQNKTGNIVIRKKIIVPR